MNRTLKNVAGCMAAILIASIFFTNCRRGIDENVKTKSGQRASSSSIGIGSGSTYFDFNDTRDLAVAVDYYSTGFAKQLICYRPGQSVVWIFNNTASAGAAPNFVRVFASSTGIGASPNNFNMNDSRDRIVPYDLTGTGKLDHIICYRPGTGNFWIFRVNSGSMNMVLKSTIGVGNSGANYNLNDNRDVIVPFDYYGTGYAKQLICYRPGTGTYWVMNNTAAAGSTPNFVPVHTSTTGVGSPTDYGFDLMDSRDILLPWDVVGTGLANGLLCYRPGTGIIRGYTPVANNFMYTEFYSSVGLVDYTFSYHYDLSSNLDRLIPYDYFSNGSKRSILCYRPGAGHCWMFTNYPRSGGYGDVQYNSSGGIGSGSAYFNLTSISDKVFAYDYNGTGKLDHLICYRPGSGAFWIFNNSRVQIY